MCTRKFLSPAWWPCFQFFGDLWLTGRSQQGRQPVGVANDLVGDRAGFDLAGPTHHLRDAESAFPVGVFLIAEGGHSAIRPGVHMRAVVGGIHHDRIFGDAQFIQVVQHLANLFIVLDHDIMVERLPAAGLSEYFFRRVDVEMHPGGVKPDEERLVVIVGAPDEVLGRRQELGIAGFHAFPGQRAGVFDLLLADAPQRGVGGIVFFGGPGTDHAASGQRPS